MTGFYLPAHEWGGPIQSIHMLARALKESGILVDVLTTNTRGRRGLNISRNGINYIDDVPIHYHNAHGPRRYFFSPGMMNELLNTANRYDLLHLHGIWTFPNLAGATISRLRGIPHLLSPRGSLKKWAMGYRSTKKRIYLNLIERRNIRSSSMIHFITKGEQEECPEEFRKIPSVVIPNCIDYSSLSKVSFDQSIDRSQKILMLGRIHPVKGFDVMIPALAILINKYPNLTLVIAGPDESGYKKQVIELAKHANVSRNIVFRGTVNREGVSRAFEECSMLAMPSYQENFGMAAAEAMAAGIPVIVSEHVDLAPSVRTSSSGIVVQHTAKALSDAIDSLLQSPDKMAEMGSLGRRFADINYSMKSVAIRMVEAYETVLQLRGLQSITGN